VKICFGIIRNPGGLMYICQTKHNNIMENINIKTIEDLKKIMDASGKKYEIVEDRFTPMLGIYTGKHCWNWFNLLIIEGEPIYFLFVQQYSQNTGKTKKSGNGSAKYSAIRQLEKIIK